MLVYKLRRACARFFFIIRFITWKLIYRSRFSFPFFYASCIDTGANIKCINGYVKFKGKFVSRRNLTINVTSGRLNIGKNVFFNQGVSINCLGQITIGDHCIFGEDVKLYDHNHKFKLGSLIKDQGFSIKSINIGENVWLGSNVIVLSGVTIGDNVVVSAGSIVREDIPTNRLLKNGELVSITGKRQL